MPERPLISPHSCRSCPRCRCATSHIGHTVIAPSDALPLPERYENIAVMRKTPVLALLAVLVFAGLASPAGAATYDPHLTRAPYLTDLVGLHVIVNFATDQSGTAASVQYGPSTARPARSARPRPRPAPPSRSAPSASTSGRPR